MVLLAEVYHSESFVILLYTDKIISQPERNVGGVIDGELVGEETQDHRS